MQKQNSFITLSPPTTCSENSTKTSPSYHIPATLSPFFSKQQRKNHAKYRKQENFDCLQCSFFRFFRDICGSGKRKSRKNHVMNTQISTDQEQDRGRFSMNMTEGNFEEKKTREIQNQLEFIKESHELNSTSKLENHVGSQKIINESGSDNSFLEHSRSFGKYPLNTMFLFRNPDNSKALFLAKIYLNRGNLNRNHSFENLKEVEKIENEQKIMRNFSSFIGRQKSGNIYCKIIKKFLEKNQKNMLLDLCSDTSSLTQFAKNFNHVVSVQTNFFVASCMRNELQSSNNLENIYLIVADLLKLKDFQKNFDVIHLNLWSFKAHNLEKNIFFQELTIKYLKFCGITLITFPKLSTISQVMSFFSRVSDFLSNSTVRIIYNISKSSFNGQIIAVLLKGSKKNTEETCFLTSYFLKRSQEESLKRMDLTQNFQKLTEKISLSKIIHYINVLEGNFTPNHCFLHKFLEVLHGNNELTHFLREKQTCEEFLMRKSENLNKNISFLDNSRIKFDEQRSFSSYSKDRTISESEELKKSIEEIIITNSESKPFILNVLNHKNISSV